MPLRIKSLELHGYKTFASHTEFQFAEGITAIVGPNGSGKSNIADALRWVLGEQSYSLLRGKKTEDMIFAGSEQRPRAGMASVTVVFDNSTSWLPVDFSEVAITRRAYRDGRNEYLINDQQVRLRDINDLLAASGLSERTYTIIGQGLVDASLALRADERRRLFEEAAGIGLYRSRREEALRRLEATRRNLERVLDILAELEPRLKSLERQARRAAEYARAQADLKVLLREWYGYHWHRAQEELSQAYSTLRAEEARVREARQASGRLQEEAAQFRARATGLRAQRNAQLREASECYAKKEAIGRQLAALEERLRAQKAAHQSLLAEQERLAGEEAIAQARLAEAEQEVQRRQGEQQEAQEHLTTVQSVLEERQQQRAELESQLEQAGARWQEYQSKRAEVQARLDELTQRIRSHTETIQTTLETLRSLERGFARSEERWKESHLARQRTEAEFAAIEKRLDQSRATAERLAAAVREQMRVRDAHMAEQARLQAQLEVLEQAESTLAGYAEGVRTLLEAARHTRLGVRGALSAVMEVPVEFETAVAAALGEAMDAVLLPRQALEEALGWLEQREGRATMVVLDRPYRQPHLAPLDDPECLGNAADLVRAPEELAWVVEVLLGDALIVSHRAAAQRLLNRLPDSGRLITLNGEVFRPNGVVVGGKPPRSGTLGRLRRRRELQQALEELRSQLLHHEAELTALNRQLEEARQQQAQTQVEAHSTRAFLEAARRAEQEAVLALETARSQLEVTRQRLETSKDEIAAAKNERERLEAMQIEIETGLSNAHEQVHTLTSQIAALTFDELQQQVMYWGTRLAVAQSALVEALNRRQERVAALAQVQDQRIEVAKRLEQSDHALVELEAQIAALREQEAALAGRIDSLNRWIELADRELEALEQEEQAYQEREGEAQRLLANAERSLTQVQLEVTRRQEALASLRQRIEDDFGLVQFDYGEHVLGPVPLPLEGMVEQLPVVTTLAPDLEEQLKLARQQLRRMGAVNPEAQQEYEAEVQRFGFLKEQVTDLQKAEADLRQVIAELDKLTQRAFYETFERVAAEFRTIFVRLFGGGSARLTLTDPENLVETGIEIEARLPGRREQGLALLSGGERSLTAIALVFALLKVSPTPVCVLDEVDAMLDEANVGRFRDLLKELSRETQFVIITHNRNTVEVADVIYGVTMGRDSASRVISLKPDEITDKVMGQGV